MSKSKTNNQNSYEKTILDALSSKYGLSHYYIRQSINGNVKGVTPDAIKKDYLIMEKEFQKTVQNLINKTLE
ncbi:hypothetical protein GON26_01125 [Flavobacterium sp. GA093]|uniref:Uncharacterized protein n=1 Tax=Flavobacterium hydrocarbonoxydans TaxID=2683249 RepID=A0A6I4NFQ7_9FLAO|nr:hypothetical protein [Flavobacterium hydrocarbonoxydans]MWB92951.1 hypothetical protein [Flavobacterium hydrocarbonoxydans]